jgi:voltage-gated sodium channel
MQTFCERIVRHQRFQAFIVVVILLAGVLVGLETYPEIVAGHGGLLHALDRIVLGIFCIELALKFAALWPRPARFFRDGWNVFDFIIVAVCLLPFGGSFAAVLRLARVLRVLRLVTAVPKLQILVGAMLRSLPSMGYVAMLLGVLVYVYAVLGTSLFGKNDPLHFGSLQISMLTLFQIVTLEGWADILFTNMYGADHFGYEGRQQLVVQASAHPFLAPAYFVSFIFLGTMIMLNLLIGVVINSMNELHEEAEAAERAKHAREHGLAADFDLIEEQLEALRMSAEALRERIESGGPDVERSRSGN